MKIQLEKTRLLAFRDGGEKIYSESRLLHLIKMELISQGHDVIKKRMWKDGHMMGGDETQYIRERKWAWCAYDGNYALRLLYEDYNKTGEVSLIVEWTQEEYSRKNGA